MKTYPITDHIPESELTAITPEGAARWFVRHDWVLFAGQWPDAGVLAREVEDVAKVHRISPRQVIAEMQADTRIIEAGRKVAGR